MVLQATGQAPAALQGVEMEINNVAGVGEVSVSATDARQLALGVYVFLSSCLKHRSGAYQGKRRPIDNDKRQPMGTERHQNGDVLY
jgi:hypothetical protein